jgi:hypothetical protein
LQNTYTRRFNVRHRAWGRLLGDRYKAVLVEGDGYYFETLLDYIHLNPVRAGLVKPQSRQSVMDYPWNSVAARVLRLRETRQEGSRSSHTEALGSRRAGFFYRRVFLEFSQTIVRRVLCAAV